MDTADQVLQGFWDAGTTTKGSPTTKKRIRAYVPQQTVLPGLLTGDYCRSPEGLFSAASHEGMESRAGGGNFKAAVQLPLGAL